MDGDYESRDDGFCGEWKRGEVGEKGPESWKEVVARVLGARALGVWGVEKRGGRGGYGEGMGEGDEEEEEEEEKMVVRGRVGGLKGWFWMIFLFVVFGLVWFGLVFGSRGFGVLTGRNS